MYIASMIARRLSIGGSNRTASVIAGVGVACTLTVMLLTVAISMGFKQEIRAKLAGFMPQISLNAPYALAGEDGADSLQLDADLRSAIAEVVPRGSSVQLTVRRPGVLKTPESFATQVFTAYDSAHNLEFERSNMLRGTWLTGDTSVVISQPMAAKLAVDTADKVTAYFFADGSLRARRLRVSGIYASYFGNYDNTVCYVTPAMLQHLQGWSSNTGTSVEINGIDADRIDATTQQLYGVINSLVAADQMHTSLTIDNINGTGAVYINWLQLLDTNVVVIFVLMSCVSALTLISSLFILILNNVETIGIFRAMGMPRRSIRAVFRRLTMRIVGIGMLFGNIFAVIIIAGQYLWHVIPLNPEMYYLTYVPVHITPLAWLAVNAGVAVLSWLIIWLPARLATSISVTTTLRYE